MSILGRGKKKDDKPPQSEDERDRSQDARYGSQGGQSVQPSAPPMAERRMEVGEAIAQAIITLDHGDIKKFSFLTKDEELTYALWYALAETYGLDLIRRFINVSLRMRVSIDGKGRDDIVRIASAHIQQETTQQPGVMGRMRSFMGI